MENEKPTDSYLCERCNKRHSSCYVCKKTFVELAKTTHNVISVRCDGEKGHMCQFCEEKEEEKPIIDNSTSPETESNPNHDDFDIYDLDKSRSFTEVLTKSILQSLERIEKKLIEIEKQNDRDFWAKFMD